MNKREFVSSAVLACPLTWSLPAAVQACPPREAPMSLAHWRGRVGQRFERGSRGALEVLRLTEVREQASSSGHECFTLVFEGGADAGEPGLTDLRSGDGGRYSLFLQQGGAAGRVVAPFQRFA